jgi:hypothetical protein
MSKKEQELYRFIHSLNKGEKKQIGYYLQRYHPNKENKLQLLFDSLNSMQKLQSEKIIAAYKDAGYNHKYLAADRNKLFEEILAALIDSPAQDTASIRISTALQKANLLFEKKFFKLAQKHIQAAKKQARRYEIWGSLTDLLFLEQRILKVFGEFEQIASLKIEIKQVLEMQSALLELSNYNSQSTALRIAYAKARHADQITAFDTLIDEMQALALPKQKSFYLQFHYLETLGNYYFVKNDAQALLQVNEDLIKLMETYPWYLNDQPLNYVAIKTRLLALKRRFEPQAFKQALKTYRQFPKGIKKQIKEVESSVFIYSHNYELDQALQEKNWTEALDLLPTIEEGLIEYKNLIDPTLQLTAYYRMAYACFFNQKFEAALDYLLRVINDFPVNLRPDVYHTSLLVQIILHYELGNHKLIPYLIKNVKYYIDKRNTLYETETLLLKSISKIAKTQQPEEELFELRTKLEELKKNSFELPLFEIFDFVAWLEMKLRP